MIERKSVIHNLTDTKWELVLVDPTSAVNPITMNDIDKYISRFNPEIQSRLGELRRIFLKIYPECEESIRYNMPAYKIGKYHLYFAAYKKHIGFYPVYGLTDLEEQLSRYRAKGTKDTLHFMHDKPLPIKLITEIIRLKSKLK